MPRGLGFGPGSCALRLDNIDWLSSDQKTELISSVANDISAAFIYIAKQAEAGNLTAAHTASINDVIKTIRDTEAKQRRRLEQKIARYRKAAWRWRRKKVLLRMELRRFAHRTQKAVGLWKEQTTQLKYEAEDVQKKLEFVQEKYELLKAKAEIDKCGSACEKAKEDVGIGNASIKQQTEI
jgi:hypothetical protein